MNSILYDAENWRAPDDYVFPGAQEAFATADIFDAASMKIEVCDLQFLAFGTAIRFAGQCSTVRSTDNPRAVIEALSEPGDGRILVIDGTAVSGMACLGDRLGRLALENGWVGVIVHGAIRDTAVLDTLPLGLRATSTTCRRPFGSGETGERNVTVTLGGARFTPGDMIYVDADAVVVVPAS